MTNDCGKFVVNASDRIHEIRPLQLRSIQSPYIENTYQNTLKYLYQIILSGIMQHEYHRYGLKISDKRNTYHSNINLKADRAGY